MSLAETVRILGRGPGRSRSLTEDEAQTAMRFMLAGDAAPEAIGALLMLLRMKGETAQEIAGFASAAQKCGPVMPQVDLDWPSYAAGRTRGAPWFLLSAKEVAETGKRVLIHGWNGNNGSVRDGLEAAGIPAARSIDEAHALIDQHCIAYVPLEMMHPTLFQLLRLRDVLGLRSCINTVCRMLNPGRARASVQGVFHPSYRLLQADAARLLGWQNLTVIKGGGGEFEVYPAKAIACFGLRDGELWEHSVPPHVHTGKKLIETWAHWPAGADCPGFESAIVEGTTTLALSTAGQDNKTAFAA